MSAVSRALEVGRQWAEQQAVRSSPVSRWGPPVWPVEEPVEMLQRAPRQLAALEVLALVLLQSGRSS